MPTHRYSAADLTVIEFDDAVRRRPRTYFGTTVLTADIAGLDVHGPYCADPSGPGTVLVRDRRA